MSMKNFQPLTGYEQRTDSEMLARATSLYQRMKLRRTVRDFSSQTVDLKIVEECVRIAGTAPNGANLQPWHFAIVSDPELKRRIRMAAEAEEKEFYQNRAPDLWLKAISPLGTDENKPFLETAPHLIVVFGQAYRETTNGDKQKNYYVSESVGIATGFLISALHHVGLATLTHTPSPMKFLGTILDRPEQDRAFLILVVGHPAENAVVPDIGKKSLEEFASLH